jgi:hypothetical protein
VGGINAPPHHLTDRSPSDWGLFGDYIDDRLKLNYMLDVVSKFTMGLMEETIFTAVSCTMPHELPCSSIHFYWSCERK